MIGDTQSMKVYKNTMIIDGNLVQLLERHRKEHSVQITTT